MFLLFGMCESHSETFFSTEAYLLFILVFSAVWPFPGLVFDMNTLIMRMVYHCHYYHCKSKDGHNLLDLGVQDHLILLVSKMWSQEAFDHSIHTLWWCCSVQSTISMFQPSLWELKFIQDYKRVTCMLDRHSFKIAHQIGHSMKCNAICIGGHVLNWSE